MVPHQNMDLGDLPPSDVFRLALQASGKGFAQVRKEMGWHESFAKRVLSDEKFYPSYVDLPRFCRVVGNTLVIQWLTVKVHEEKPAPLQKGDCHYLSLETLALSEALGALAHTVKKAIADNTITDQERRTVIKKLRDLIGEGIAMLAVVKEAESKVQRCR